MAPARHHALLLTALEDVASGACDRLMVLMPPGSAKSTYASVLFPAWWFTQHPRTAVIAASHTGDLAMSFGRKVRNTVAEYAGALGYGLATDSRSAGSWSTTTGGEYYAAGIGGPITGRRADLAIIDDPVKSHEEADSLTMRDRAWDWYRSDLYTRLKPGGRIVLIMTRWHQDDLGGRLLNAMETGEGDTWRVIKLPALAGAEDPLGRAPGEPLWPEWESAEALRRKQKQSGSRVWSALYQQEPVPAEGLLFQAYKLGIVPALPAGGVAVRAWDLAGTDGGGDWTVGLKLIRYPAGNFVIADVVRIQGSPAAVENAIKTTAHQDGRSVRIGLPQDPGQAGKSQVLNLVSKLAGYSVTATPETGSKILRATPAAAQVEVGNISLVAAPWNRLLIDEFRDFPSGRNDDQVDAFSRAFAMLIGRGPMVIGQEALRHA